MMTGILHAQKTIGRIMREKEQCLDGNKRKQRVMDKRFKSLTKQSIASPVKVSKSGSNEWIKQLHLAASILAIAKKFGATDQL